MTSLSNKIADQAHELIDYDVVDQTGDSIGSLHSFWADAQTGQLDFIGVKTGWLFGANHVIPVQKVEIDDATRTVRLPYTSEFVKGALSIDADATISDAEEAEINRYFQVTGAAAGTARSASLQQDNRSVAASASERKTAADGTVEVALTEEQVRVGKRTVEAGNVRLRKIVRTEIVNQPVEIRHEDVVIERVSADQVHAGAAASNFQEEVIDVPLTREEVVVQKDAHVTGAVRLHKTSEVEQQNVSETVRKEDVEVLRDGEAVKETDKLSR